jgi:hypothetical protein
VHAFHAGCFLDPLQHEDYAGPANKLWARGILLITNLRGGDFDGFEWIEMRRIQELYG